jgi:hypothetical protein
MNIVDIHRGKKEEEAANLEERKKYWANNAKEVQEVADKIARGEVQDFLIITYNKHTKSYGELCVTEELWNLLGALECAKMRVIMALGEEE